jgi:hypothetical protein
VAKVLNATWHWRMPARAGERVVCAFITIAFA